RTDRRRRGPVPPGAVPEPVVLVPTPAVHLAVGAVGAGVVVTRGQAREGDVGRRAHRHGGQSIRGRAVTKLTHHVLPPAVNLPVAPLGAGVEMAGHDAAERDALGRGDPRRDVALAYRRAIADLAEAGVP